MAMIVAMAAAFAIPLFRAAPAEAQDNVAFAQQRFIQGVAFYESGDYARAAATFEASLKLYESPNSRLYLARSYEKLDRLGEAMAEYQRAERESAERATVDPRYAATRDAAIAAIAALRPNVAHVVVKVSPGPTSVTARVAGRAVPEPALGLPIAVTPGPVDVAVSAPGHLPFHNVVTTRPAEQASVYVTLVPSISDSQRRNDRWRAAGWVTAGIGGAALVAGGIFGILAQRQYHDLVSNCGFAPCAPEQPDDVAAGRRWEQLMKVSLIGGGIAALGGGVMLLLGYRSAQAEAEPKATARNARRTWTRIGGVGWDGRTVIVEGRF